MKVEPIVTYRQPKYPCAGEKINTTNVFLPRCKNAALIAAVIAASGTLTGCRAPVSVMAGAMPAPNYLSEQEMIQILQYEAEELGISFYSAQGKVIKYFDNDIALDLYNEECQIGVAVVDKTQGNSLYESLRDADEPGLLDGMNAGGVSAKGSLEDEQPVNFFLASEIAEYDEENLRQAFREFIEWLQSEGII